MKATTKSEIEQALTELIVNCQELSELEGRLTKFNIFRVLRAAKNELRHSNMLAWLLNPEESHGLGDRFLRRWLMKVVHDAYSQIGAALSLPSPIEIDALEIDYVDVAREHENIDLLLLINTIHHEKWVICVENKVESRQHSNQLNRYKTYVEHKYAAAAQRLYIFLTKYNEPPEDTDFISSSYEALRDVLSSCVESDTGAIQTEPRLLIKQYLDLLSEDFVDNSKEAQLARQIYKAHRMAIDFILENRNDPISEASSLMQEILATKAAELGIELATQNKGWIRFIPAAWNVPQNRGGTAWGQNSRYVVCEVAFWTKTVELHITVGKAPSDWADLVWERAAEPPFKQEWKKRPTQYIKPYKSRSEIRIETLADLAPDDARAKLSEWIEGELAKEKFKEAVGEIEKLLPSLKVQ